MSFDFRIEVTIVMCIYVRCGHFGTQTTGSHPFSELATEKGNADAVLVHQQFTCLLGFVL